MAHDKNPFVTMGVSGTAGTSDTTGTAEGIAFGVNPTTGAQYVEPLGGTLSIGTTTRISNIGTLELGSVAVTTLPSGGTILNLANGTLSAVTTVSNLTNGSVNLLTGTLTSVSNVANGTVRTSKVPVELGTSFQTRGTTGAAVWGTIIAAAGSGTKQYVSNVDIVVASGTVDVAVTNIGVGGSTGAGILARGQFPAGGGIAKKFDPVNSSGSNGTLSFWLGGAGTVDITIQYWQGV